MSEEQIAEMKKQVEQLTCFIDCVYAGFANDIKITWAYSGNDDRRATFGKHEEITIGASDPYYRSSTLSHMLYEQAYHMRERLIDQINEATREPSMVDLVARA